MRDRGETRSLAGVPLLLSQAAAGSQVAVASASETDIDAAEAEQVLPLLRSPAVGSFLLQVKLAGVQQFVLQGVAM